MVSLTSQEIWDLKVKFLSKIISLREERLKTSVNASDAWDEMGKGAFDKKTVFPFIVSELIEEELIKKGDNPDEVIIIDLYTKSKRLRLLEIFNNILNHMEGDNSLGVTLNVGGTTIAGLLISLKNYYNEMQNLLSQHETPTEAWIEMFEEFKKQLPRSEDEWKVVREVLGIGYICLKKATYIMGSTSVPTDGRGLWIGRLESVDGFMMGTVGEGKEPPGS